jgi:hypothetical protein
MGVNCTVMLEAGLKGGYPNFDINQDGAHRPDDSNKAGLPTGLLEVVRNSLERADEESAVNACRPHLSATFLASEIPALDCEAEFETDDVVIRGVRIERDPECGQDVILFGWLEATFTVELPRSVVMCWARESDAGFMEPDAEAYEEWMSSNDACGLQDGALFWFAGIAYELTDGSLECFPNADSVREALR